MEGQNLADQLMAAIDDKELIDLINNSNTILQIINRYRPIINKK